MSLKGQMHNYRMKYTGEGISLTLVRSWTYDTMTISWGGVQVMDKSDPINLPATVTVALRHKNHDQENCTTVRGSAIHVETGI